MTASPDREAQERRRDIARDALARAGMRPVTTPATKYEPADPTARASRFAMLTHQFNGRAIAVNPRHVLSVLEWDTHDSDWQTVVVLTHGDPIRVAGTVEDVVAQLEAAR